MTTRTAQKEKDMPAVEEEIIAITLATATFETVLSLGRRLITDSQEWASVVYNRRRWRRSNTLLDELHKTSREQWLEWGLRPDDLGKLHDTGTVQVTVPLLDSELGSAARRMPWEFVLSSAVRPPGSEQPLLVIRHVPGQNVGPKPNAEGPRRALFLQNSPGRVSERYTFDSELQLVQESLKPVEVESKINKTIEDAEAFIEANRPHLIHLAGVDNFEGATILSGTSPQPGVVWSDAAGSAMYCGSKRVAEIVTAHGKHRPCLVSYNLFNSSSETAAWTVARGALAAIGFQDEFDNALSDIFFTNLYAVLAKGQGVDVVSAFRLAFQALTSDPGRLRELPGSVIALWMAEPVLGKDARPKGAGTAAVLEATATASVAKALQETKAQRLTVTENAGDVLQVEVDICRDLNYCLLHNGESMFNTFILRKPGTGRLGGICVTVEMQIAGERFSYEESFEMTECSRRVDPKLSLTSQMARALKEKVQTSAVVRVRVQNQDVYCQTHRIGLLAIDEWQDSEHVRRWLPSFVLPRDPAIEAIISKAQPYLCALADSREVGFSGYQGVNLNQETSIDTVDRQVKAIWWAFNHHVPLNYVGAMPTFTASAQRLRTPSAVMERGMATCLDVVLMLAACLEAVRLKPVIFLQPHHAFLGYLTSQAAHDELSILAIGRTTGDPTSMPGGTGDLRPWAFEKLDVEMIRKMATEPNPKLKLVDAVVLTGHERFAEALAAGKRRFSQGFDAMYDIGIARREGVTPLPLCALE